MSDSNQKSIHHDVCPESHAGILSTPIRRLIHNPEKILCGLIEQGQTVADIGCGPGFFTLPMAKLVGDEGCVIAVDLQQGMLNRVRHNAEKAGLTSRIKFHLCEPDKIGITEQVDFALAFYIVHEAPDASAFLKEIHGFLKSGGHFLLSEPKMHVSAQDFQKTTEIAEKTGFKPLQKPRILMSRSVLYIKP